jgi:hypothetical protein
VDGTASGSRSMASFCVSGAEPSGSTSTALVSNNFIVRRKDHIKPETCDISVSKSVGIFSIQMKELLE